jgi:ABC-type transporter Mla subunit MlaD
MTPQSGWEPGDLRTGVLVLLAFGCLVAGVIWGASSKKTDMAPLYAEFPRLTGVSTETPVMLNGYKVGQVDDIEPRTGPLGQLTFRVRMSVLWHPGGGDIVPYRTGMRVLLTPPAIEQLGTAILRLEPPAIPGAALSRGATIPVLPFQSPLEGARTRIDSLGGELTRTLTDTRALLNVLVRTASAATGAATATAGVANAAAQQLTVLATDTRSRLAMADSLMHDVRTLTPGAKATADSLQALLGDSRRAVARLTRMADANEPQLTRTLASLDTSSALLQHFIRQVSAKPLRVLTGVAPMPASAVPAPESKRAAVTSP